MGQRSRIKDENQRFEPLDNLLFVLVDVFRVVAAYSLCHPAAPLYPNPKKVVEAVAIAVLSRQPMVSEGEKEMKMRRKKKKKKKKKRRRRRRRNRNKLILQTPVFNLRN